LAVGEGDSHIDTTKLERAEVWDHLSEIMCESDEPRVGQRFGKFQLLEEIGVGATGVVYKARQTDLDRVIALKIQRLDASIENDSGFLAEASSAARLNHTNIVHVYEVGDCSGYHYIAMELVDGAPLDRVNLAPREVAETMSKVALAVHYAHDMGLLHRDLKPQNLMWSRDGRVRVTDFGLARRFTGHAYRSEHIAGTPVYMAPEQAEGTSCDGRTDVYSLGATMYHLLTGRPPFDGDTVARILDQVRQDEPQPLRQRKPDLPRELEAVTLKAMAKEPARRYRSARELSLDLDRFLRGEPVLARPASAIYRIHRRIVRHRGLFLLATSATIALSVLTGFLLYQFHRRADDRARAAAHARLLEDQLTGEREERLRREQLHAQAKPDFDYGMERFRHLQLLLSRETPGEEPSIHRTTREALARFERALEIDPNYAEAALQIARIRMEGGDYGQAAHWCDRAISLDPSLATAYLCRMLIQLQRYDTNEHSDYGYRPNLEPPALLQLRRQVRTDLEQVRRWEPGTEEIAFALGLLEFAERKYLAAAEQLQRYLERRPTDWLAQAWCAHAFFHAEQFDIASTWMDRALRSRPRSSAMYSQRGSIRLAAGQWDAAIEDFTRALQTEPTSALLYLNRALAKARGNRPGAAEDFGSAIELNPDWGALYYERARWLQNSGKLEEAIRDYSTAIAKSPSFAFAYVERADAYNASGRSDRALLDLSKAIELYPEFAIPYLNRGHLLYRRNDLEGALRDFSSAIRHNPRYVKAYVSRAAVWLQRSEWVRAIEDTTKAIDLDARNADAYGNRGLARARLAHDKNKSRELFLLAELDLKRALELADQKWPHRAHIDAELRWVQNHLKYRS